MTPPSREERTSRDQPPSAQLFQPAPGSEPQRTWLPMAIGLAIVAVAVALGILILRAVRGPEPQGPPSYASQLKLSDLRLSQAQNFVGGTVTYLEGKISNAGDKTVTGASVNVIFHNALDEIVQKELLPVRILDRGGPYPDTLDMRLRPLAPGQQREFRLTFEHLSSDWNQQAPELRVVGVALQ
jgi:Protein of unknown function (DUF2393)